MNPDELKEMPKEEFKKPLFMRFQDAMNDPDTLRNIRTGIILIIALGAPILYFGFVENIQLEGFLTWRLGFLAIMAVALVKMVQIDTRSRAFEDEILSNVELNKVEKEIYEENKKVKNHKFGHKFVNKYNEDEQRNADETATDKRKNVLNYIKSTLEIKGKFDSKKYKKVVAELEHLKDHNIRGKYKPIDYSDVHSIEKKGKKGGAQAKKYLNYDPKKENFIGTTTSIFIKGATMGGAGSIPFLWSQSWKVIIIFYLTFILSILSTILQTYIKTRRKTEKKYLPAREFKLNLQRDMNKYIAEQEREEEQTRVQTLVKPEEPKAIEIQGGN